MDPSRFPESVGRFALVGAVLLAGSSAACSDAAASDVEVAEAFTWAFAEGDVATMQALASDAAALGVVTWRAEFLAALDLEVDSLECAAGDTTVTCTIVGHNARTELLAPDLVPKRSLHLTIDDGVVDQASFEFASPELAPVFDAFSRWAMANRSDVMEGPCADFEGESDPTECAIAVLDAAIEYVRGEDG